MMWRFPKTMEGKKLRWSIEGQIHSTFTTSRYFETRVANFCGDIEEKLIPLEEKKDKDKDKGGEKAEKSEKKDKDEGGEKSEKSEKKEKNKDKGGEGDSKNSLQHLDTTMRTEFEEWLEFKKYREEQKKAKSGGQTQTDTVSNKLVEDPVMPSIAEAPESDATTSEQQGMGKKAMNLKLDIDEAQSSLKKNPSVQRAMGYNGRWLGSPDMEPLSPPVKPLYGERGDDFYTYPDSASLKISRSGNISSRDGEQRIKGLSVRSGRSRMDSSDSQRE